VRRRREVETWKRSLARWRSAWGKPPTTPTALQERVHRARRPTTSSRVARVWPRPAARATRPLTRAKEGKPPLESPGRRPPMGLQATSTQTTTKHQHKRQHRLLNDDTDRDPTPITTISLTASAGGGVGRFGPGIGWGAESAGEKASQDRDVERSLARWRSAWGKPPTTPNCRSASTVHDDSRLRRGSVVFGRVQQQRATRPLTRAKEGKPPLECPGR